LSQYTKQKIFSEELVRSDILQVLNAFNTGLED